MIGNRGGYPGSSQRRNPRFWLPVGYLVRRVLIFLVVVWAAATVNFVIPRLARGDPVQAQFAQLEALGIRSEGMAQVVAAYRAKLGLDRPLWQQYFSYL